MASADKAQKAALRLVIEQQSGLYVVGTAKNTHSVTDQVLDNGADLLLLDCELPVRNERPPYGKNSSTELAVRDLINHLRSTLGELRIIILTLKSNIETEALAAGANAVVRKTDPPERILAELVRHIRSPG